MYLEKPKMPLPMGICAPVEYMVPWRTQVHTPHGKSVGSIVLTQLTAVCNKRTQTHRPRYIGDSRPRIVRLCMRCGIITILRVNCHIIRHRA